MKGERGGSREDRIRPTVPDVDHGRCKVNSNLLRKKKKASNRAEDGEGEKITFSPDREKTEIERRGERKEWNQILYRVKKNFQKACML